MNSGKRATRSIYLLKRVETIIKHALEEAVGAFGVTPGQYTTMSLLRTGVESSSAAMARRVGISAQSMSEMITLLQRKEFVERRETPGNRRILQIGLTPAGHRILDSCEKQADLVEARIFESLSSDEVENLRKLLTRIVDAGGNERSVV